MMLIAQRKSLKKFISLHFICLFTVAMFSSFLKWLVLNLTISWGWIYIPIATYFTWTYYLQQKTKNTIGQDTLFSVVKSCSPVKRKSRNITLIPSITFSLIPEQAWCFQKSNYIRSYRWSNLGEKFSLDASLWCFAYFLQSFRNQTQESLPPGSPFLPQLCLIMCHSSTLPECFVLFRHCTCTVIVGLYAEELRLSLMNCACPRKFTKWMDEWMREWRGQEDGEIQS